MHVTWTLEPASVTMFSTNLRGAMVSLQKFMCPCQEPIGTPLRSRPAAHGCVTHRTDGCIVRSSALSVCTRSFACGERHQLRYGTLPSRPVRKCDSDVCRTDIKVRECDGTAPAYFILTTKSTTYCMTGPLAMSIT